MSRRSINSRSTGRAPRRASSPPPERRPRRRWLKGVAATLSVATVLFAGWMLYLDWEVRQRFEGPRWALPGKIFARALELHVGQRLSADTLLRELRRLKYDPVRRPERPGTFSRSGDRFVISTRPFAFWDGAEPNRLLQVDFDGGRIAGLGDLRGGQPVALARLDPPLIGNLLPAGHEDRALLTRDALPELLVRTLIAVEDRDFEHHGGVNPKAIARALWANLRAGGVVQGGSTLTQQLVKNLYLSRERSLVRKANEALMALILDARYAKDEILTAYANEIYLGQDGGQAIHGFALASRFWFNRELDELDLPRTALLVALIRGPSYYDPRRHPERALERRNLVLRLLAEQGVVSGEIARLAAERPLLVSPRKGGTPAGSFPAFVDLVRRQLREDYRDDDLRREGLRIFTSLDPEIQAEAEQALARRLAQLEKGGRREQLQGAVVVARVDDGAVVALVGDREPSYAGFNRALDALRPIGSLAKPAVFLTALQQPGRYALHTTIDDQPLAVKGADGQVWRPRNYDRKSHGAVTLEEALAHSYNLATVRLGMQVGLDKVVATLRRLGVDGTIDPYPSLLLGSFAMSPLAVTQSYQTLAAGGFRVTLRAIRGVTDKQDARLSRYPIEIEERLPAAPVFVLNEALRRVVADGTGRALTPRLPPGLRVAGKTGTTDDLRDSWFAGFSGDLVATVWIGRDDNASTGLSGASGALLVWGDLMRAVAAEPFAPPVPEGIEWRWAGNSCAEGRRLPALFGSPRGLDCAGGSSFGFLE